MKILVTGATGYIGQKLALELANQGNTVHALVRDTRKAETLLNHPQIKLFVGDILDQKSLLSDKS